PHLGLPGITARDAALDRGDEALARQPGVRQIDLLGRLDLDAEVVDRASLSRPFEQYELEGRLIDGEVCVTGTQLRQLGGEQLGVERDRGVEVVDVEGELDAGHGYLRAIH